MLILIKSEIYALIASLCGFFAFAACVRRPMISDYHQRTLALLIYCITAAFLSPTLIIYNTLAFLTVPIFAGKRYLIAPVYIFALLTFPAVQTPLAVGSLYLTTVNATTCLTIGAAATALARGGTNPRTWTLSSILMIVLFVIMIIPAARSTSFTNLLRATTEALLIVVLPFYVFSKSVRSPEDAKRALVALVFVGVTLSTLAFFEARKAWPLYRVIFDHYGAPLTADANVKMRGGFLRSAGPFPEPLSFSYWLALITLCAIANSWMFKSKMHHAAIVLLMTVGLLAAQSRGALIGLACGLIIYNLIAGRVAAVVRSLVVVAFAGGMIYAAALTIPRVGQIVGIQQDGTRVPDYRERLLTRGIEEVRKHPLFGVEPEALLVAMADMRQGEGIIDFVNSYLYVALVAGIVGLIFFAAVIFLPIWSAWNIRKRHQGTTQIAAAYLAGAFGCIAFVLSGNSLGARTVTGIAIFLSLCACLSRVNSPTYRRKPAVGGSKSPSAPLRA